MKVLISIILSFCTISAFSGLGPTPRVTKHVDFANMKFVLSDAAIREIQKDVDALRSSPDHFQRKLDLASLYFPIIERVFKEQGVPEDFKYLAIQESGLISDAVSSANAVGYWQFKDFTAREVGLRVDNRIDERKNIVAASRGAAKYLKRNNSQLDNWAYALSSYQAGLGGVRRYVDEKYFGAKKIPIDKKTHWYLKKYIAHKIAFEEAVGKPHSAGLQLQEYKKGEGKDIHKISKELKVEEDLLKFYNKWIKYGKVPADKKYTIIVPVNKRIPNRKLESEEIIEETPPPAIASKTISVPQTKQAPSKETKEEEVETPLTYPNELKPGLASGKRLTVKINGVASLLARKGDNVASLSKEMGISEKSFRKNNDLGEVGNVVPGEIYYLKKKKNSSEIGFHVTLKGETLWDVSQRYGIKRSKLAKKNRISIIDELKTGQVLWLSRTRPAKIPIAYHSATPPVIVQASSSKLTSNSSNDKRYNPEKSKIKEEEIKVDPIPEPELVAETKEDRKKALEAYTRFEKHGKTHTIEAGETFWSVSQKYDITVEEIHNWNDLTKYDVLRIGQELFVQEPRIKEKKAEKTSSYRVKPGDTLYQIALKHEMDVSTLMLLNKKDTSVISVGEELIVYKK